MNLTVNLVIYQHVPSKDNGNIYKVCKLTQNFNTNVKVCDLDHRSAAASNLHEPTRHIVTYLRVLEILL